MQTLTKAEFERLMREPLCRLWRDCGKQAREFLTETREGIPKRMHAHIQEQAVLQQRQARDAATPEALVGLLMSRVSALPPKRCA